MSRDDKNGLTWRDRAIEWAEETVESGASAYIHPETAEAVAQTLLALKLAAPSTVATTGETPRTDAYVNTHFANLKELQGIEIVDASFARQLERELDVAQQAMLESNELTYDWITLMPYFCKDCKRWMRMCFCHWKRLLPDIGSGG